MRTVIKGIETDVSMRFSSPDIGLTQDALIQGIVMSKLPVLITGESGTGKELLARAIHVQSATTGPFVVVDCGALTPSLAESELFGYRKGAFTGAVISKVGLLASAPDGTIFLDELSELPIELQPKLLRVLQERELRRIGDTQVASFDSRVIAATNQDLGAMVRDCKFRADLYNRVNVLTLHLPPLRERRGDLPSLCASILSRFESHAKSPLSVSNDAMKAMFAYDWPGNVRELENCLNRIAALKPESAVIEPSDLPQSLRAALDPKLETFTMQTSLREMEKSAILNAIEKFNGDKQKAAKSLGIGKTTIYRKLSEYIG